MISGIAGANFSDKLLLFRNRNSGVIPVENLHRNGNRVSSLFSVAKSAEAKNVKPVNPGVTFFASA
jgi:hypothetical protein